MAGAANGDAAVAADPTAAPLMNVRRFMACSSLLAAVPADLRSVIAKRHQIGDGVVDLLAGQHKPLAGPVQRLDTIAATSQGVSVLFLGNGHEFRHGLFGLGMTAGSILSDEFTVHQRIA